MDARDRIVVGVDGSDDARRALRWAVAEAKLRGAVVEAIAAWSYPWVVAAPGAVVPLEPLADQAADAYARLDEAIRGLGQEAEGVEITPIVSEGGPAAVLRDAAADAQMLVVGSRGVGRFERLLLGSVSGQLARHAPCTVVVVPSAAQVGADATGRVVVGVDGSDHSVDALRWAIAEGERRGVPVVVLYAWTWVDPFGEAAVAVSRSMLDADAEAVLADTVKRALDGAAPPAGLTTRSLEGDPGHVLTGEAGPADLLVVGARGHGGFLGMLLGSVATHVAHHSDAPVVIVRPGC
jgi:nucleotide-binding universal stress UspA family protein